MSAKSPGSDLFPCPACDGLTRVTDSRAGEGKRVRRTRECVNCGVRTFTRELSLDDLHDLQAKAYRLDQIIALVQGGT